MKTVVITGATSFLGRNIIKHLLKRDYIIYALVRESSKDLWRLPNDERIHYIYGSLNDLDIILKYVKKADCFIHFAWDGSGYAGRASEDVQNMNVLYSQKALRIADTLGCGQFIFPGSQAEYGICHELISEATVCKPLSAYGKAKVEFSKYAADYCMNKDLCFIHLRIFSVYGPDDREGTLVDVCVRNFNLGRNVELGSCVQNWNYLYIMDFVEVISKIIENKCTQGVYNIASDDTRPLKEFVQEIYNLSNKSGGFRFGNVNSNPEGSPWLNPDITKIKEEVNWQPQYSFREGIQLIMDTRLRGD